MSVEFSHADEVEFVFRVVLRATLGTGDVNDSTGYSPFPGNINQLIMSIPEYAAVLERTKGAH